LRIWFDILTPKQIMFFKNFVERLKKDGHDVLCTSRRYREVTQLASLNNLQLVIVGRYGGEERYDKLKASCDRIIKLSKIIKKFNPDMVISFSSPDAARVSFGLGIKHYVFNDSPHAEKVARLTIPLIDHLFCPWVIPISAWNKYGIEMKKITMYQALDPYVWTKPFENKRNADKEKLLQCLKIKIDPKKKIVLIRPDENKASYIIDNKNNKTLSIIDKIVENLADEVNVIILCRYSDQIQKFKERYKDRVFLIGKAVDGRFLLEISDLFIGGGGTMTAEAVLLGVPTISVAPIDFTVEEYLIKKGLIKKIRNPDHIIDFVNRILQDLDYTKKFNKKSKTLRGNMEDPIEVFMKFVKKNQP